ncbi:MAG: methyl-accepting chemotaxis protein [Gammaproteobacteria bacterium]|nr:methyl-accepting chemotaxis protein [Gammaproteobacteria bacterium]
MKPSILRNLKFAFYGFGLSMGLIFPVYAQFFVEWKEGMFIWFFLGCIAAGLTIGVANFWLVKLVLLKRLTRISEVANAISNKDLRHNCEMESHDLVGEIIASFNRMADTLRTMCLDVSNASDKLMSSSSHLIQVTEQTSTNTLQQQSDTNIALTAVIDVDHSIQQVAANTREAAEAAQNANSSAQSGAAIVQETISQLAQLSKGVDETMTEINQLESETISIGSVLDVIRGISEQTNLLALNAAIEAARAGEHGRGFAVVADEVRTLASRTNQSTQDIQEMIERLQNKSKAAVATMERSHTQLQHGVESATEAGSSLQVISSAVQNISNLNHMISVESEQQGEAISRIHQNMDRITEVSDSAVANTSSVMQAGDELSGIAQELRGVISEYQVS